MQPDHLRHVTEALGLILDDRRSWITLALHRAGELEKLQDAYAKLLDAFSETTNERDRLDARTKELEDQVGLEGDLRAKVKELEAKLAETAKLAAWERSSTASP